MWALQREHGKCHTRFLPSAQGADRLQSRHPGDLEVAEVLAVFLLRLSWEPVREELDGVHGGNQRVHMVLRKVATVTGGRVSRGRVEYASKAVYTRSLPLRFTCPDSGANSLVKSLILAFAQPNLCDRTN